MTRIRINDPDHSDHNSSWAIQVCAVGNGGIFEALDSFYPSGASPPSLNRVRV